MKRNALSIVELLVCVSVIAVLGGILFPVLRQAQVAQKKRSNAFNLRKLARAAFQYSQDADGRIPIFINGKLRDLKDVADGRLTSYHEPRSDMWPLILLPYLKDRKLYVDPDRGDQFDIWSAPPLATTDAGYDALANTFRNQNRMPMFGINYGFLSPLLIPASKFSDATPADYMVGESHSFAEAEDPGATVFYTTTFRGYVPANYLDFIGIADPTRGWNAVNAPGLWTATAAKIDAPVLFWTGADATGDWYGVDIYPETPGKQTRENFYFPSPAKNGNNVSFLDLHVRFETTVELAAGTNYLTASPGGGGSGYFGGGTFITDRSAYQWNLNENYYGA